MKMRKIYLNEESIVRNFERVFGYKNESMARRLYKYLANYKSKARITFDQYARRFFKLIYGTLSEKNRISFCMYDYNCNGSLSLLDIYDLLKYYEEGSKLHQEADILIKDISNNLGKARRSENYFNYNYFTYLVKSSYLSKEIVNKMANGLYNLSFHDPKCNKTWDSYTIKNLTKSTSKNFISIIIKKSEKKRKEQEELKQQQKELQRMMWR